MRWVETLLCYGLVYFCQNSKHNSWESDIWMSNCSVHSVYLCILLYYVRHISSVSMLCVLIQQRLANTCTVSNCRNYVTSTSDWWPAIKHYVTNCSRSVQLVSPLLLLLFWWYFLCLVAFIWLRLCPATAAVGFWPTIFFSGVISASGTSSSRVKPCSLS